MVNAKTALTVPNLIGGAQPRSFNKPQNSFILPPTWLGAAVISRQSIRSDAPWIVALLVCAGALLAPAVYNGFPLLFPDSDAYFEVAYGHQWTLDRSGFYGLFLKPFLMPFAGALGIWLAIAVTAGIVTAILLATARRMLPHCSATQCAAVVLLTALISSLCWHTAQLMPDAFTGALILLAWIAASRDADAPGSPLLWLGAGLLTLVHYTHLPLFATAVLATLVLKAASGTRLRRVGKRIVAGSVTLLAVVAAHVSANGLMFDRWTISPMGGWFLFARVHQDGLAQDWLARHCGRDAPAPLCRIEASLPRNSQTLLWSKSSPLYPDIEGEIGTPAYWNWTDMLGRVAIGSIREEPFAFVRNSTAAGARQFLTFRMLDDHCPAECKSAALLRIRPALQLPVTSSRQLTGTMHADNIRFLSDFVESLALLAMVPLLFIAISRRDSEAQCFLATILTSLAANATITGALSDVQPRYQSRVVWLAVFAFIVVVARWRAASLKACKQSGDAVQFTIAG
jgi:hypothetical protein